MSISIFAYICVLLGGWSEVVSLDELPDPNNMFANALFGLGMGRRNMYTTDNQDKESSQSPNVTIGYVVAMRATNKKDRKIEQKRICFIYMKTDEHDQWGTQYSWTVDKTACLRNIRLVLFLISTYLPF